MPGIFGAVGCSPAFYEALKQEFSSAWTDCQFMYVAEGVLGGHALRSKLALYEVGSDGHLAVDGEESLYREVESFTQRGSPILFRVYAGKLELSGTCKGNVALIDARSGTWYLAAEWTGTFPLYYMQQGGAFVFSSRLRPLARVFGAIPDSIGIAEFLLRSYMLGGRTYYQGIRRLLPGQALTYEPHRRSLYVYETSSAWVGTERYGPDNADLAAEAAWDTLKDAVRQCLELSGKHALMISAGWDSRVLLLAMLEHLDSRHLLAYSHGDLLSRELRITEAICRLVKVQWCSEPLDDALFDLDFLQRGFDRVENVVDPQWHRAGLRLANEGVTCISAGVYGEVLGGHYGPPMLLHGGKKIAAVAAALLGRSNSLERRSQDVIQSVYEILSYRELRRPWYLSEAFWESLTSPVELINADLAAVLQRFERRGVATVDQLVEAFLAEHRGTQSINTQLLSCRAMVDIALPFCHRDLLILASRILFTTKFQNSLNRKMLQQHAPHVLRFSSAATFFPVGMPIPLQEASRASRWLLDKGLWKLFFVTHGWIGPPRSSWWNFEFLRNGAVLHSLVDDLKSDIWDKEAFGRRIANIVNAVRSGRGSPIYAGFFLKVYTTDLMLR